MKNKKYILKLLVCLCVCFSWVMTLSACSEDLDNHNLSETWKTNASFHWHECLDDDCDYKSDRQAHVYDDDNDLTCNVCGYERSLIQTYKTVTITGLIKDTKYVKTGETATFSLSLEDKYNPNTLKIKNGNEEISWTIDPNYSKPSEFSGKSINVGTLEIANVQGDLNLTTSAEEYTIDFSFKATIDANDMTRVEDVSQTINNRLTNRQSILEDFTLSDGKTLYYALTNSDYLYKPTASERASNKIELTSRYDSEIYSFNTSLRQSPKTSKSETNKKFYITLDENDLSSNSITFIVDEITLSYLDINSVSGTLGKISVYDPDNDTTESGSSIHYTPSQNAQIRVTLIENDSFDLSNVKVYINQTQIMNLHTKESDDDSTYYYFDVSKEKSPTYYNNGTGTDTYDISITGVNLKTNAEDVTIVSVNNETITPISIDGDRLSWTASACYYFDKAESKIYFVKNANKDNVLILNGCINKLSISANDTTYTIDLTELLKTENGVVGAYSSENRRTINIDSKLTDICPLLKLGNCDFELTGIDTNEDRKFTIDEIINIKISLITNLPDNVTITILG